jgi:hypothetical protein
VGVGACVLVIAGALATLFVLHRVDSADCAFDIASDRVMCHASHVPTHAREAVGVIGQTYIIFICMLMLVMGVLLARAHRQRTPRDTLNGAATGA